MNRAQNPNIVILEAAVARLGPLAEKLVFLGGCATVLMLTDEEIAQAGSHLSRFVRTEEARRAHAGR